MTATNLKTFNPSQPEEFQNQVHKENYEEISKTLNKQNVNKGDIVKDTTALTLTTSFQELKALTRAVNASGGKHLFLGAVSVQGIQIITARVLDNGNEIFAFSTGSENRTSVPLNFMADLSPGNHTISVEAKTSGGAPVVNLSTSESYLQTNEFIF